MTTGYTPISIDMKKVIGTGEAGTVKFYSQAPISLPTGDVIPPNPTAAGGASVTLASDGTGSVSLAPTDNPTCLGYGTRYIVKYVGVADTAERLLGSIQVTTSTTALALSDLLTAGLTPAAASRPDPSKTWYTAASTAAMQALTNLNNGDRVFVDGKGVYRVEVPAVTAAQANVAVTSSDGTTRFVLDVDGKDYRQAVTPELYGARGDGLADDTNALKAALAAGVGKTVLLTGTYRLTSGMGINDWPDNVRVVGTQGSAITLDFSSPAGIAVNLGGLASTALTLGANAAAGDTVLTVTNTLSAGDYVFIADTRNSGRYPVEVAQVLSATSSTVTLQSPLRVPYTTANGATLTKFTPRSYHLEGVTFQCSATSDLAEVFAVQYCKDVFLSGCRILDHRAATNPASQVGFHVLNALHATIANCYAKSASGNGNSLLMGAIGLADVSGFQSDGYAFGPEVVNSVGPTVRGCAVRGVRANGNRGIKLKGVQMGAVTGNTVAATDSGIKIEDCGRCTITGNTITDCGFSATSSAGINVSPVAPASAEGGRHAITGNVVRRQIGEGIALLSSVEAGTTITGNTVDTTTGRGIDTQVAGNVLVADNRVIDWGTSYAGSSPGLYSGIVFKETDQVTGNSLHRTDAMGTPPPAFAQSFTAIAPNDGTVFALNSCQVTGTGFASTTGLNSIGVNFGNHVIGLGQKRVRDTAAPAAGTWEVGDYVENSAPTAGSALGWRCTTAGTPGTWEALQFPTLGATQTWTGTNTFSQTVNTQAVTASGMITAQNSGVLTGRTNAQVYAITATQAGNAVLFGHPNSNLLSSLGETSTGGVPMLCYYAYQAASSAQNYSGTTKNPTAIRGSASTLDFLWAALGTADAAITWNTAAQQDNTTGTWTFVNGIKNGTSGTTITQQKVYAASLTPSSVAANTSAEQTFTVSGLTTADKVFVNGPAPTAGTGIVGVRVSGADTLAITFANFTAGSLTPASGTYNVVAIRS